MARKVILIVDPGIDTAVAVAFALCDPHLDVIGLIPQAGNISADRASANVQILIEQLDPPKWPRIATALPIQYDEQRLNEHGPDGLGGANFPTPDRHQHQVADKVLVELVHEHAGEVSIINLGPCTTLAHAFDRDPNLAESLDEVVLVGGSWNEPGNAGPVSEFHFWLDPLAVQRLLKLNLHPTIVPLDVSLTLSPAELLAITQHDTPTGRFLAAITPFGLRASAQLHGIEGLLLNDVLGVAALSLPGSVVCESRSVMIETTGELTKGMLIVDTRRNAIAPNAHLGIEVASGEIRQHLERVLSAG